MNADVREERAKQVIEGGLGQILIEEVLGFQLLKQGSFTAEQTVGNVDLRNPQSSAGDTNTLVRKGFTKYLHHVLTENRNKPFLLKIRR